MNTTGCPNNLDLYALDGLSPEDAEAIERHLAGCVACRDELARLRGLLGTLQDAAAEPAAVPPALRRRLHREIWVARVQERCWSRHPAWLRAAAAVAALFGVGCAVWSAWQAYLGRDDLWIRSGICTSQPASGCYPVVSGDTVTAVESKDGCQVLLGLDRITGRRLWETPFAVRGGLSADRHRVYAWRAESGGQFCLVALDNASGREVWSACGRLACSRRPWPTLATADGVAWSDESRVVLLDAATGITRWTRNISGEGALSVPATDRVNLYVASAQSVQALDPADGHVLWLATDTPSTVPTFPPLVQCDGRTLAVVRHARLGHGSTSCRDAATGTLRWSRETEMPWHLAVGEGRVFLRGTHVCALDGQTGAETWSVAMGGCSPIEVAGGCVYTVEGLDRKGIFALRADTGRQVWAQRMMSSCSGFSVSGRMGYLSTQDGTLRAVSIRQQRGT
jgi:outer membrane protein assembly factor BamB